jgi:tripartite-type tricarboxylate transporter receptor subunit TctC
MRTARITTMLLITVIFVVCAFMSSPAVSLAAEKTFYRLIVTHAPGSGVDGQARILSDRLAKVLGKPVVVENNAGAGGIKGVQEISRAAADGYTLGLTANSIVINPSLYKQLPYDPLKDVTPIAIVGTVGFALVTSPGLPVQNVKELIALAKAKPDKLNYASAGNGTTLHLAAELFCSEAGVKINHVPFKGGSQLLTELMGNNMDMAFYAVHSVMELVKAGKLKALGVSTPKRSPALPNVPTIAEAGVPGYSYDAWFALIGPTNLPQPIVKKIHTALMETLKMKEVRDAFAAGSTEVIGSTPEEAVQLFKTDYAKNAKLVKQSGMTLD